ncbi:hypothetical protein [Bradyrhizobium lablabi]|uniref:hypothetical protein n=1 Tax=Bradyrhizobium lablabi TaxID=722472 RepID=UPI001BA93DB6|nr:hypothetical protein [Bradyrhizobium lablabi]MBR0693636.1 hypothetical protein [Bradyrhizobium lablabi]
MLQNSPKPMNAAQRAWATRRAMKAIQTDRETLKAGIETPAPAFKESKPVVDLNIDHHAIGCGMRRYVVLEVGPRLVRLFYYPTLTTITVDRLTFDRKAKYARDSKRDVVARIIRQNLALADKINTQAQSIVMSDGGADAAKALEVLR